MDQIFQSILPGLGAFGPFAVLAWWIINTQQKVIEAKEALMEKRTEQFVSLVTATERTMAELKGAIAALAKE